MIVYYFTGTGNSLKAARDIAGKCGGEVRPIREAVTRAEPQDAVGFVFPVYHGGLPNAVERFIRDSSFVADYFFVVATCGAVGGAAIAVVGELLRQKGQTLHYGKACRTYPNYITKYPMFRNRRRAAAKQDGRIAKIAGDIAGRVQTATAPFGGMKWASERAKYPEMDRDFSVSDSCEKCGLCVKICPVGNISLKTEKPQFSHRCEQCMACIQWCPHRAINTPKTVKRRRYTNPAVRAEELIDPSHIR